MQQVKDIIQFMKKHLKDFVFGVLLLASTISLTYGQGTLVIQHSGATDPTTEGFTLGSGSTGQVGGLVNDIGFNAWSTILSYSSVSYYSSVENISGLDWELTGTLRIVNSSSPIGGFHLNLTTGSEYFNLEFGSDANGTPVAVQGSL